MLFESHYKGGRPLASDTSTGTHLGYEKNVNIMETGFYD